MGPAFNIEIGVQRPRDWVDFDFLDGCNMGLSPSLGKRHNEPDFWVPPSFECREGTF